MECNRPQGLCRKSQEIIQFPWLCYRNSVIATMVKSATFVGNEGVMSRNVPNTAIVFSGFNVLVLRRIVMTWVIAKHISGHDCREWLL